MAVQPDLPFFGSETGYQQWRDEIAAHRAELERQLGVPIGSKVRLCLHDFEHPFTGVLELIAGTGQTNPRLRIASFDFDFGLAEISSIERLK